MRMLVTGGAGFIGSHVCEALIARGHTVVAFDNFDSGFRENLLHLPQVEVIEGDIREPNDLLEAVRGMDAVVHLAAEPSVPKSVADPRGTHNANYVGTLNVLEAMRAAGVKRIVYASSAAVYSPDTDAAHHEEELPDPTSPYGVDKLAGEFLLKSYARMYSISPTALRFFNIYGERQDPRSAYSGVISVFMDRAARGERVVIHGDGLQSRDFVYVRDLAAIIAKLVDSDRTDYPIMNLATGRSTTLIELLNTVEAVSGRAIDREFGPARIGDIRISLADNRRITHCVPGDWTPLSIGLHKLWQFLN